MLYVWVFIYIINIHRTHIKQKLNLDAISRLTEYIF